jgi:hypothetical protein
MGMMGGWYLLVISNRLPKMLYWRNRPPCVTVGRNSAAGAPSMPPPLILAPLPLASRTPSPRRRRRRRRRPAHSSQARARARARSQSGRLTLSTVFSPLSTDLSKEEAQARIYKRGAAGAGRCCWPAAQRGRDGLTPAEEGYEKASARRLLRDARCGTTPRRLYAREARAGRRR